MSTETKEYRYDEAISLKESGNPDDAIQKLESLCADFPDYALPHAALSMMYSKKEDYAASLRHAAAVCELEPEDPFSYTALSLLARQSGDKEAAEDALGKAQMAHLNYHRKLMEERKAENES